MQRIKATFAKPSKEDLEIMKNFFSKLEDEIDNDDGGSDLGDFVFNQFTQHLDGTWRRCLIALDICLETFTDPNKDYIDIKPNLIEAVRDE